MKDVTSEFFDDIERRGHNELLERISGTLRVDLKNGDRVAPWLIAFEHGDVKVTRQKREADCVVQADKALFEDVVVGKRNAMASFLRGTMTFEGAPELLVQFQRLFPWRGNGDVSMTTTRRRKP